MRNSFTYNNHLQYGFGQALLDYSPGEDFIVKWGESGADSSKPIEAAKRAAKIIHESTNQKVLLCLSGGLDSQAMARAFLAANVGFEAVICNYGGEFNAFDIDHALSFCEDNKIKVNIVDIDLAKFCRSKEFIEIGKKYRCGYPQTVVHLKMLSMIDGFAVMAGNPIIFKKHIRNQDHWFVPSDNLFAYHRYWEQEGRQGVGHFFLYTPELINSFIELPLMKKLISTNAFLQKNSERYHAKYQLYQDGGFEVFKLQEKQTGFEDFEEWYFETYKKIWSYEYSRKISRIIPHINTRKPDL